MQIKLHEKRGYDDDDMMYVWFGQTSMCYVQYIIDWHKQTKTTERRATNNIYYLLHDTHTQVVKEEIKIRMNEKLKYNTIKW